MYGENAKRYAERQLASVGKKEVNDAYRNRTPTEVSVAAACKCSMLPYSHYPSTLPEWMKRRHDGPYWKPF